jgi:hypothetical protein
MLSKIAVIGVVLIQCGLIAQTDTPIPMRIQQPQIMTPLDALLKAQQLRKAQLDNQALQQQIEQQQRQTEQRPSISPQRPLTERPVADNQRTLGFVNGRLWNTASIDMKVSYIVGIAEAVALMSGDLFRYFAKDLSPQEEAKSVDMFYNDPGNLAVPVSFALQIVAMKANGGKPEAVETFTANVKRAIIEAPAAQK